MWARERKGVNKMHCNKCPLSFKQETDYETGEYDIICAVTMNDVYADSACTRTNKWIKRQDINALIDSYWELRRISTTARAHPLIIQVLAIKNEHL